jgi:hypothetical protein
MSNDHAAAEKQEYTPASKHLLSIGRGIVVPVTAYLVNVGIISMCCRCDHAIGRSKLISLKRASAQNCSPVPSGLTQTRFPTLSVSLFDSHARRVWK